MGSFNWKDLMTKWNTTILNSRLKSEASQESLTTNWLGHTGADTSDLDLLEARLKRTLPPSLKQFLMFSNGWSVLSSYIDRIRSSKEIDWFYTENSDWAEEWATSENAKDLLNALQISDVGDESVYVLNPNVIDEDGEWEAWAIVGYAGELRKFSSFSDLMESEYDYLIAVIRYENY